MCGEFPLAQTFVKWRGSAYGTWRLPNLRAATLHMRRGGMGVGKTRLAMEAAKAFAERRYKEAKSDNFDLAPGSRVVAYAEVQAGYALLVSKSQDAASSACAVAVCKAFGMSVGTALITRSA